MSGLEKGSRKFTCPSCGAKKKFRRYIDKFGDYLDEQVGRCDRESSCGYHLTPKQYKEAFNVQCSIPKYVNRSNKSNDLSGLNTLNELNKLNTNEQVEHFDVIDNALLVRSLEHTARNRFLNFLLSFMDADAVAQAAKDYFVATTKDGKTVFWQIDTHGHARTGKIISYDETTGKRDKSINPSWIHYELRKAKILPESFKQQICFFGEHLLRSDDVKPIAIVEAEKTAVVASVFIDKFVWLACGGKSYLKAEKLLRFKNRKIVLYPDADGFDLWNKEAEEARRLGLDVSVSEMIHSIASEEEKKLGFDLADYLIRCERTAVEWNRTADRYNFKLAKILSEESLINLFDELYEERLAITESESLESECIRSLVNYIAIEDG